MFTSTENPAYTCAKMFEENLRAKLNQGMALELAVAKCKAQVVDYFMNWAKASVVIDDSSSYYDQWIFLEQDLAKICALVHQDVKSDTSIDGVLDTLFEVVIDVAHVPAKRFAEMAWKCL